MVVYRQLEKELAGDEWNLGKLSGLSADYLWDWVNTYTMGYDVHVLRGRYGPCWVNTCG